MDCTCRALSKLCLKQHCASDLEQEHLEDQSEEQKALLSSMQVLTYQTALILPENGKTRVLTLLLLHNPLHMSISDLHHCKNDPLSKKPLNYLVSKELGFQDLAPLYFSQRTVMITGRSLSCGSSTIHTRS